MSIKHQITHSAKEIIKDRYVAGLLFLFLFLCAFTIIFLVFKIRPSELQVVVHYTSFGSTNFYRDKWYYLLTFPVFISVLAVVHGVVSYKLLNKKGRDFAITFLWFSIILILVTITFFYQILKIASLS